MEHCEDDEEYKFIPGIFYEFTPPIKIECVVSDRDDWIIRTFRFAQCLEKISCFDAYLFIGRSVDEDDICWFFLKIPHDLLGGVVLPSYLRVIK